MLSARQVADRLLLAHHCFDLSPAAALAESTARELGRAADEVGEEGWQIDLGERTVVPADRMWVEYRVDNQEFAMLIEPAKGPGVYLVSRWVSHEFLTQMWLDMDMPQQAEYLNTLMADETAFGRRPRYEDMLNADMLQPIVYVREAGDGMFEAAPLIPPSEDADPSSEGASGKVRTLALRNATSYFAALAIINSPRSERQDVPAHRGLAKEVKGVLGRSPNERATRIVLKTSTGSLATGEGRASSPRAYHFCRAHTRLKGDRVERVRSHWRGDPAFGIRIGAYDVHGEAAPSV